VSTETGTNETGANETVHVDPDGSPTNSEQTKVSKSGVWRWVRNIVLIVLGLLVAFGAFFAITFVPYVKDSQGEPMSVLIATWGRDHGLGPLVASAEDFYYAHFDKTPVGGVPTESADFGAAGANPSASASGTPGNSSPAEPVHLKPPATLKSPVTGSTVKDEGVWQPVASKVAGVPAIYATRVRPDAQHTSVLASLMWIDTKLAKAIYVPGYIEPAGPNPSNGALPEKFWPDVLANTNGAFRLKDSQGGYIYEGKVQAPMVDGKATFAIDKAGKMTVGAWGTDIKPGPDVYMARQNLDPIIVDGKSKVKDGDGFAWGATTHGENAAWRSAIGERADGSLVYIGSPGLTASAMADTMIDAGVKRAMVLDMNNWWVAGFYFTHDATGAPVCKKLDPNIQEGCDRFLNRYKRDSLQFLATQPLN